jgi:hypothetical protein
MAAGLEHISRGTSISAIGAIIATGIVIATIVVIPKITVKVRCNPILAGPNGKLAKGALVWTPTKRYVVSDPGGNKTILPSPVVVHLDGINEPVINLQPTNENWCYVVSERLPSGESRRAVVVPNTPATLAYGDLAEIDERTLNLGPQSNSEWNKSIKYLLSNVVLEPEQESTPPEIPGNTLVFRKL